MTLNGVIGVCDLLIAIAYFSIPLEIIYYVCKTQFYVNTSYKVIACLFVLFILLCGMTHGAQYYELGPLWILATKLSTAVVSILTATVLLKIIPEVLTVPVYTRELEENLREQLEELQEADIQTKNAIHTRNIFMQFLCHELRNPLFNITNKIDFLLESKLSKDHEEIIRSIGVSSEFMTNIVNDVRDISALEEGRLRIDSKAIDLWWICQSTAQQCSSWAVAKDLDLRVNIEQSVYRYVFSDPIRIHQILMNLISNAIKFTPRGWVQLHVFTHDCTDDSSNVVFEVRDTGIGIAQERFNDIFTPYVNMSSGDYQEGSGLGLSITKAIVDLMNGHIDIKSQLHMGTTFTVRMSFKHATKREVVRSAHSPIHRVQLPTHYRVLVTEDNVINRKLLVHILSSLGIETDTARDGQECVEKITADPSYHLILMDIMMPRMNGYAATREVRRLGYDGPIIALTANAHDGESAKSRDAGMNHFMTKPVKKSDIAHMLKRYLAHWSPLQATSPVTPGQFDFRLLSSPGRSSRSLQSQSRPLSREASPHTSFTLGESSLSPMLKKDDLV